MGLDAALLQYNSITLLFYAVNVLNYMFIHCVNTTYICKYCFMWSFFKKEKKIYTQTYLCCNLYLWIYIYMYTYTHNYCFFLICVCVLICLVVSNSLQQDRLLYRWNFPGKNTEESCHFLLQDIFWIQGLNLHLLSLLLWQADSLLLRHLGSLFYGCSYF